MNKTKLRQLNFGFEIEGLFNYKLGNLPGEFKTDGSVDVTSDNTDGGDLVQCTSDDNEQCSTCEGSGTYTSNCDCDYDVLHCDRNHEHEDTCYVTSCYNDSRYHEEDCEECSGRGSFGDEETEAKEYASKPFLTLADMLLELSKFKNKGNYWNDESCGLHLHISLKNKQWQKLYNCISLDFLRLINKEANKWCPCQESRLEESDNHYYQFWKNRLDFIKTFNKDYELRNYNGGGSCKFRFMRFHEKYKTLEFRFLSPCEHKCANVENLISLLTDYLAEEEKLNVESDEAVIPAPQKESLIINLSHSNHKISNTGENWQHEYDFGRTN